MFIIFRRGFIVAARACTFPEIISTPHTQSMEKRACDAHEEFFRIFVTAAKSLETQGKSLVARKRKMMLPIKNKKMAQKLLGRLKIRKHGKKFLIVTINYKNTIGSFNIYFF